MIISLLSTDGQDSRLLFVKLGLLDLMLGAA